MKSKALTLLLTLAALPAMFAAGTPPPPAPPAAGLPADSNLIIDNRPGGGVLGDPATPEQRIPANTAGRADRGGNPG
jgi:hypothetical protein